MAKGERGGKHRGGTGGVVQKGGTAQPVNTDLSTNTRNVYELSDFLKRNYGITVDENALSQMDFKTLWSQAEGIEEAYRAFPELKPLLNSDLGADVLGFGTRGNPVNTIRILGERTQSNVYATMSSNGFLNIGNAIRKSPDLMRLLNSYENTVQMGFHPAGTNASHISSHELGHLMVNLVKNAEGGGYIGHYWGSDTANSIVKNAWNSPEMKAIRKQFRTDRGREMSIGEGRRLISSYATENNHETVAEAVAQYSAVGSNSPVFTRAIVKELKARMIQATQTNSRIH